jgi:casein kinase 1
MKLANYIFAEKIGQGAFGTVYKGHNMKTGKHVVIKTEPLNVAFSSIKHESNILNILYSKHCRNIPPTYWYGVDSTLNQRALVMPFYDESLENFAASNRRSCEIFDSASASNIMRSAISILSHIHDKYVVHRDIKPANFMIHKNDLILIDFGLASFYVDSEERHIPPSKKQHIIGTPKYASWNIHRGEEYSRRDDLMSVVYVGLFLLYGTAPTAPSEPSDLDKTSILHPRNQWFMRQKNIENIRDQARQRWQELSDFAVMVYGLSFQERPSYREYIDLFSKTI